jgi:hypothetical protein
MRTLCILAFTLSALSFAACGGGGDDDVTVQPDANTTTHPDAALVPDATQQGVNDLGTPCDPNTPTDCAATSTCVVIGGLGSQTMGYCSPMCTQAGTECADGYTGPATGQVQCAITEQDPNTPVLCAIICTTGTDCPNGLACTDTGQGVSICTGAP